MNVFSQTLQQSTHCESFLLRTIPDIRYTYVHIRMYVHLKSNTITVKHKNFIVEKIDEFEKLKYLILKFSL